MKIVEAAEVRQRLTMPVCIDLMRASLRELEAGTYTQPLRSIALLPGGEKFGFMLKPVWGTALEPKVLSAFPQNAGTQYPSHIGYVLLFEGSTAASWGWLTRRSLLRSVPARSPALPPICWPGRTPTASLSSGRERRAVSPGCHDRCAGHPFRDCLRPKHPGGPPLLPGDGEKIRRPGHRCGQRPGGGTRC